MVDDEAVGSLEADAVVVDDAPLFAPPSNEARDWVPAELVLDEPLDPVSVFSRLLRLSDWAELEDVELLEPPEPLLWASIRADKSCDENWPAGESPIGEIGAALAS